MNGMFGKTVKPGGWSFYFVNFTALTAYKKIYNRHPEVNKITANRKTYNISNIFGIKERKL